MYRLILAIILLIPALSAQAQTSLLGDRFFRYSEEIPEDFLSSKAFALVHIDHASGTPRPNWKSEVSKLQEGLAKLGVDVAASFYREDFMAGSRTIFDNALMMRKRKMNKVIFFGKDQSGYTLIYTDFNRKRSLTDQGQNAFKIKGTALDVMFERLEDKIRRGAIKRNNLLVMSEPEYFPPKPFTTSKDKLQQKYTANLNSGKLAIPNIVSLELPEGANSTDPGLASDVRNENQRLKTEEEALKQLWTKYPYEYGFVDYDKLKEDDYRKQGYRFVILCLKGSESTIRTHLNWQEKTVRGKKPKKVDYGTKTVYKFYVKHILTQRIFTGDKWDGASTKTEALNNFLSNLLKPLER
ncbi:hypothetical protein FUAX_37690 [Fulvitalea axinellae]|uniref:Uncharacterized protein n=1 Tax=Fulvitalea axinellae TaxID=1182444 RepID=A0AAU9CTL3_9BACT|nr:hypothetical protein FUAX_37690 [Fulvitalea axinellae]